MAGLLDALYKTELDDKRNAFAATILSPQEELAFVDWARKNGVIDGNDYDMRGFYRGLSTLDQAAVSSINPNDGRLHFPDKWKLPNHRTFSTDSQYFDQTTMPQTPTWSGGPIETKQGLRQKAEHWVLRRPNGDIVESESPFVLRPIE